MNGVGEGDVGASRPATVADRSAAGQRAPPGSPLLLWTRSGPERPRRMGSRLVTSSARARHALPLAVLVLFSLLDLALGRDQWSSAWWSSLRWRRRPRLGRRATVGYTAARTRDRGTARHLRPAVHVRDDPRPADPAVRGGHGRGGRGRRLHPAAAPRAGAAAPDARRRRRAGRRCRSPRCSSATCSGPPPHVAHLETAVRYLPATRHARGGR